MEKIKIKHEYFKQRKIIDFIRSKYTLIIIGVVAALSIIIFEFSDGEIMQKAYAKNIENNDFISGNTIIDEKKLDEKTKNQIKYFASIIGNNEIALITYKYSKIYQIEPSLLISIMKIESRFNVNSRNYNLNKSIDRGLLQLNSNSFPYLKEEDFFDPDKNIMNGTKYLKWCLEKSNNNLIKSLALYNAGIGKLTSNGIGEPTLDYIQKILDEKKIIDTELENNNKKYSGLFKNINIF